MVGGRILRDQEFFRTLPNDNVVRYRFDLNRGRVTAFTLQLECWIDGAWRPVMRYDTAHGWPHRDTLDWTGRVIAKDPMPPGITLNEAMAHAERDLTANAAVYRADFERRKP